MAPKNDFPPVRATIFDMDGLLIDSEDLYTKVTNIILAEHNKPNLPWSIKAQLQGRPGPASAKIFRAWAQLPISEDEFKVRQKELQAQLFPQSAPLPGVEALLSNLSRARTVSKEGKRRGERVHMAVATSSHRYNFDVKTNHLKPLFSVFPERQIVVGDDPRVPEGRGKPLPDIYLLALQVLNTELEAQGSSEPAIKPEECLVFEDSVPGVEAGRRAGMRVVWVPHPGLLDVYKDRVDEVLAATTGEHKESDLDHQGGIPLAGSPGHVGELQDGWAEKLKSLENFDYARYGIEIDEALSSAAAAVDPSANAQTSPETSDRALEEMTAKADGKIHAKEEGTRNIPSPVPGLSELNPKV